MENNILVFTIIGLGVQLIDGAIGMGYGVISTTILLSFGISPAAASASVHTAEVIVTAVSGISHLKLGNVDKGLIKRLLMPGVIGAVTGAYILTRIPGNIIKPYISIYLLIMGGVILWKAIRKIRHSAVKTNISLLGLIGGFLDTIGGGGWGPVVTSTLVANGNHPRYTIGSVNLAEFFVTLAASLTFILTIGLEYWQIIIGLTLGGSIAAPIAAFACKKIPTRALMFMIGVLIEVLSLRTIILTWF